MTLPGFAADASLYATTKTYCLAQSSKASHEVVIASALIPAARILPQQPSFGGSEFPSYFPGWLALCLRGCRQSYSLCLNDVANCSRRCEPDCIAGCQIRCLRLPAWQQLDCLAVCPDMCHGFCASECTIACDSAYGSCRE